MAESNVGNTIKINMETETDKAVGKIIILWRKEEKQACRIEKIDTTEKYIYYELLSGADKGKKFKSRFDASQKGIDVYDDDSAILAVLST